MASKHFMIYYKKGTGTYIVTEPRPWARENQDYFPGYTFQSNNHPTTEIIEQWLIHNKNFHKVVETDTVCVIQNLDPDFEL